MANLISIAGGGTSASTAPGARTNLGLGTLAVQDASSVSITGGTVAGDGSGLNSLDASNLASGTVPQGRKWSEATTSATGNQDDVDFSASDLLRCNNSSLLTLRGLLAGVPGQRLTIVSVGAGQVDLANQNTGSSAANRIINGVSGTISLAAGLGRVELQYDGTTSRWRVTAHEQGAPITPAYNAGDFTASGSMTWTVDSADVVAYCYTLRGSELFVNILIGASSVGGTLSNTLHIALPGGFTCAQFVRVASFFNDNGVQQGGRMDVAVGESIIRTVKLAGANLAASTNATAVAGQIVVPVQ